MKMIYGVGAIGSVTGQIDETDSELLERLAEKRYKQLITQMNFYNKNFDARRFWAYGCNCLILGDRPMSDIGLGPPIDALDGTCKRYKECLKLWSHQIIIFVKKLTYNLRETLTLLRCPST